MFWVKGVEEYERMGGLVGSVSIGSLEGEYGLMKMIFLDKKVSFESKFKVLYFFIAILKSQK